MTFPVYVKGISMKQLLLATTLLLSVYGSALACSADLTLNLETFGEGVSVELRNGVPGNSRIVKVQRSSGGTVFFNNLCPGSYFFAIGNGDSVSVTPVRQYENDTMYTSTVRMQRGSGNVSKKSRSSL